MTITGVITQLTEAEILEPISQDLAKKKKLAQKMKFNDENECKKVKYISGKGENAGYRQDLFFK